MKPRSSTGLLIRAIVILFILGKTSAVAEAAREVTVADTIEATVFAAQRGQEFLWSPHHKTVIFVVAHGDIKRNGTEFRLLGCESPCYKIDVLATLFTRSTGELTELLKRVRWLDERTFSFLWDSGDDFGSQLYTFDVPNRHLTRLTNHPTPVLDYDINWERRRLLSITEAPRDTVKIKRMALNGFVVANQGLTPLLSGDLDGWPWQTGVRYEFYVQTEHDSSPRRVESAQEQAWGRMPAQPLLSPDARYALTTRSVYRVPVEWTAYVHALRRTEEKPYESEALELAIDGIPGHIVVQYILIDLERRSMHAIWEAPLVGGYPYIGGLLNRVITPVWSPDSKAVALGPAFLPLSRRPEPTFENSVAVVDVEFGTISELPIDAASTLRYGPRYWGVDGKLVLEGSDSTQIAFERRPNGEWFQTAPSPSQPSVQANVDLVIRQGLNEPPMVVRRDRASLREMSLLDLGSPLDKLTLGRVELFHWTAGDGQSWTGELYHPVRETPGHRYPLVIQTHGYGESDHHRFELNGASTTMLAGQPLANHGIMVLQLGAPDSDHQHGGTLAEAIEHAAGYTSAIDALDAAGLIDRRRVGIVGWSFTGWTVAYTLTHTDYAKYPFGAAIIGDNVDCGYFSRIMFAESARNSNDACVGAPPVGAGLQTWLREAPGFNTDKIHTPLRMEAGDDAAAVEDNWEIFQLLRFQHKPVEMVAIPNYQHGAHSLQNPQQRLASQGGTVDWFNFWLNAKEDPDPKKAEQYTRWRQLRKLQERSMEAWRNEKQ